MLPNSLEVTLANTALQFYSMEGKAAVRMNRCSLSVYRGETVDELGRRGASISIWLCLQTWRLLDSYGRTWHLGHLSLSDSVQR